jgi:hypothetical protein
MVIKTYNVQLPENLMYLGLHPPKHDALPSSLLDPSWVQVSQTMKLFGTRGMLTALSTKRGKGAY